MYQCMGLILQKTHAYSSISNIWYICAHYTAYIERSPFQYQPKYLSVHGYVVFLFLPSSFARIFFLHCMILTSGPGPAGGREREDGRIP